MPIKFLSLLFIAIIFVYIRRRSILHPFVITGTIWFLFVLAYELFATYYSKIPHLREKTISYISLYLIIFLIVTEIIIRRKNPPKLRKLTNEPPILNDRIELLFIIIFICNLFLIFRFFLITHSFNIFAVISTFRHLVVSGYNLPIDVKLLLYIYNITFVLLMYGYLYKPKVNAIIKVGVIIEFILILLFIATKGKLLKYIVAFFVLIYIKGKLTPKVLIITGALSIGAICLLVYIRDAAFFKIGYYTASDYAFIYTLSPLPAFDSLVSGEVEYTIGQFGARTLGFFYRFLGTFFDIKMPNYSSGTMFISIMGPHVSTPTNVYTAFGNFYMDFGKNGIIVYAIAISLLFSLLYKNINKRKYFFVYTLTIFCLVLNFFGDFCFQFLSMTIQDIIAVIVVFFFRKSRGPMLSDNEVQKNMLYSASL